MTGGGLLVRGLTHADDVAKAVSHVNDVAKVVSHADDVIKATSHADDVVKAASHADDATDVARLNPKGGIYTLRDVEGNVQRSGRTKDLARREVEHGTAYPDLRFHPEFRSDSYQVQRGGEQILRDRYNPPLDKINPISPRNPRRTQYLDAARKAGIQ